MAIRASGRNTLKSTDTSSSRYLLPDEDAEEFARFFVSILSDPKPRQVQRIIQYTKD